VGIIRVIPDRIMTTPLSWVNGAPLTTTAGRTMAGQPVGPPQSSGGQRPSP
jgi:hypothetical protein